MLVYTDLKVLVEEGESMLGGCTDPGGGCYLITTALTIKKYGYFWGAEGWNY
jgi:hypothetical protein